MKKALQLGQKQIKKRRAKQDLMAELMRREAEKQQAREMTDRRKGERKLKATAIENLEVEFPELEEEELEKVRELLTGKCLVRVWFEGDRVLYSGKIEKLKSQSEKFVVAYWVESESYDDATDFDMSVFELGADLIAEDLRM